MSLARIGRLVAVARVNSRVLSVSAAARASNLKVEKFPVEEHQGVYMRKIEGKWVQCNKDGVICAEMEPSLDLVVPQPPPFHLYAELPIVKETPE